MANQNNDVPRYSRVQRNDQLNKIKKKELKQTHPFFKTIIMAFVMVLFLASAYGFRLLSQTQNALNSSYEPLEGQTHSSKILRHRPISILLLGADTGGLGRNDQGNSDTLILATINPTTKKAQLVSIPRDTLTEIEVPMDTAQETIGAGNTVLQKINSAYNMGGENLTISTIEKQLNIPIDYYMRVNFASLQKIVDGVGGIDINVPFSFMDPESGGHQFNKGMMHLNGSQALDYSRMRHKDPEGDYGRQKRQRQVIEAILKKTMSVGTLTHYQDVLNSVSDSMKTDMTFNDMMILAATYRGAANHMKSDYLHGHGTFISYSNFPDGLSVEVPSNKEMQRVSDEIRSNLGYDQEDLTNEIIRQNKLNIARGFNFKDPENQQYTLFNKLDNSVLSQPYI